MKSIELRFLEPNAVRAWLPEGASLPRLEIADDRCVLGAKVRRAFPLSSPTEYLSIQDGDDKEIGLLQSLDGLDPETRSLFEKELDRRYFSPVISRIDQLRLDAGMWSFHVQTQRGPAQFYVRNWRDSAYDIGGGRWQITSVDGLRYEILKLSDLDEHSQTLLDQVF